jgi:cell division protein ZipA
MDIDYLLIILPSIIFLGVFGLILIIWHGNFRSKKEKINLNTNDSFIEPPSKTESTSRLEPTLTQSSHKKNPTPCNATNKYDIDNYIILQLMAPLQRPFHGYELIQTLTSSGFHYGKMNIFHYVDPQNKKDLLFSLASAIEPGTFDLDNIGEIICPGLCLFTSIHKAKSTVTTFDLMWETIQTLAQDLGGVLCDKQLQPINDPKDYYDQTIKFLLAYRENEVTGVY